MAPTICSGKKRQTRTIATTNIQRHRQQGSHQLNQALSNIVNYVAKGSVNPRVSASLRIPTHNQSATNNNNTTSNYHNNNNATSLNYRSSMNKSNTTTALSHRRQQFCFVSDNAVTSGTHSDTENSFDLRLANEALTNDLTAIYDSNNTNPSTSTSTSTSLSASSSSELATSSSPASPYKKTTSSNTSPCREERRFQRCSSLMQTNKMFGLEEGSGDNDARDLYEDDSDKIPLTSNREITQIHSSSNSRNYYIACSEFDSGEDYDDNDELEDEQELNGDFMGGDSDSDADTDMHTNEDDSMTSLDTEKSAKLKRGNHPLLRDKLLDKKQGNTKTFSNTDGLLSIAIKTIKLVKRNQLLQQRLTQLQLETSEFIQSVLANPENRHFRENIKQKVQEVDNV